MDDVLVLTKTSGHHIDEFEKVFKAMHGAGVEKNMVNFQFISKSTKWRACFLRRRGATDYRESWCVAVRLTQEKR